MPFAIGVRRKGALVLDCGKEWAGMAGGGERKGMGGAASAFAERARAAVSELLSPTRCASCERPGELICERCRADMVAIDPAGACVRCGAPFGALLCTECEGVEMLQDRCLAASVFEGPPARIVRAYKDGGERRLAREIAAIVFSAACRAEREEPARFGGLLSRVDAVTFVPVTAAAYQRRGFDHMELVTRAFSELAGIPVADALVKRGYADQRKLTREERSAQAGGVYVVVEPQLMCGKRILLLDDVVTTGATVSAAARALKAAGAVHVDVLAFARVWGR